MTAPFSWSELSQGETVEVVIVLMFPIAVWLRFIWAYRRTWRSAFAWRSAEFMTGGPCMPIVLEGDNAIARLRDLMGATDPAKAAAGTIRKDFASSIEANAVHGSDSPESAAFEISYFFGALEIHPR